MISILIVDDEAVIRESIARMIDRHYPGRFEIRLAENGQQAVEYACALPIRLILADIKMPVLSGLDMLDKLRELHCSCEVIFISGFDDYAFVRRAMKRGASDYLLKPIVEEELYAQLDSFLKRAEAGKGAVAGEPREGPYYEQYMLEQLCTDPAAALKQLALAPDCRATVCAWPVDASSGQEWSGALSAGVSAAADGSLVRGTWQQLCAAVFLSPSQERHAAFDSLCRGLASGDGAPVVSPTLPAAQLSQAMEECRSLLLRRYYCLPAEDGPEQYPYTQLISQITDAVCRLRVQAFEELFSLLLRRACAQLPPVDSLQHVLCDMVYHIMQQNSAFVPVISRAELTDNDVIRRIRSAPNASRLLDEVTRILRLHIDAVHQKAASLDAFHIERAKAFIAQNYASNLSLSDLANHLALHPNYVSGLFKKVSGMSFSQYLRHVRLEEACRLISTTNDKFYLIGERVGYPDPVHFARTFKEEFGCSPKEYRSTHNGPQKA